MGSRNAFVVTGVWDPWGVKQRTVFRCGACGGSCPKWAGRCPSCLEWNTLVEELDSELAATTRRSSGARADTAVPIAEVSLDQWHPHPTGIPELDRVLGGGLVPGSVTLIGGEPGAGKSSLLTQAVGALAGRGHTCLYISAEESKQQVRMRAERLGALRPKLLVASESDLANVLGHVSEHEPDVLVVDSIQTLSHPDLQSAPGSVGQVRECTARLVSEAKARQLTVMLVGHVTKDGALAGPRVLEHLVDTVLSFSGDRHHALRLLRADKHRFGATDELGLFEMTEAGLVGVPDASALFLTDRQPGTPGSVVVPAIEGHRPLLVEVQALLAQSTLATPRRSAQGIDGGRLGMLTAVLTERVGLPLGRVDIHSLAVGGVKLAEPAADLGIALAMASSLFGSPVAADLAACGEVGLGGELRQISQLKRRMAEAARLGFRHIVVPWLAPDPPPGISAIRAKTVSDAIHLAGLGGAAPRLAG